VTPRLATAPVSWGIDFAGAPGNPPWAEVLDGIAATGLTGLELGPVGYLPETPEVLRAELGARGLEPVGSFLFEPLHDPEARDDVLATARRASRWIAASGGRILVVLDRVSAVRAPTAGRPGPAVRLGPRSWRAMRDTTLAVAEIAREANLEPVLHGHAGTFLESADEIERMLEATGLGVCADTGHLAYAGIDPAAFLRDHGPRIRHVHLKDLDLAVARSRRGFWAAVAAGAFVPIGSGSVDFAAVLEALGGIGYEGWAVLEQDRVPGSGEPVADVRRGVAHLAAT
jgi:inosose dehydratase